MKQLLKKYKHAWVFSYLLLYFAWFAWLEATVDETFHSVHITLDDYVPFFEWFIIPYFLWFPFVAVAVLYFFFHHKGDFYRLCAFLFGGMTICLLIYTIWPNGQELRPDLSLLGRENIATRILTWLYAFDTPTNVCPSIHVLNSLGVCISVYHSEAFKNKPLLRHGTFILTVLICLSTVCLKQHSVFDGICAMILSLVLYRLIYVPKYAWAEEGGLVSKHRRRIEN